MIPGFDSRRIDTGQATIACSVGGSGPPLLLLHGYPQTRAMWRDVAPRLAHGFTVVVADLRGYGESDAPATDQQHLPYSKRVMAADQVRLMAELGFSRFAVAGHDRGGRVVHRMCRDAPQAVSSAAVLDIIPTAYLFPRTDMAFASAYYHWFFLSQPADLPERLIGADADHFVRTTLDRWSGPDFTFTEDQVAGYVAAFSPQAIHASCEDYRAAATIDLVHDAEDTTRIDCPLLVMWGTFGAMHRLYDVPATWSTSASAITAHPVPSGHFLVEEAPDETAAALEAFFTRHIA